MSSACNHTARRMTAAEIDYNDRWGHSCTVSPKCTAAAVGVTSYDYRTGRRGRMSTADRIACEHHLTTFAAKNNIEVAAAPTTEPARSVGIIAYAANKYDLPAERVKVTRNGRTWMITKYGGGMMVSGTVFLDTTPAETPLRDVLPAAEEKIAKKYGLVLTAAWDVDRDGQAAAAPVAAASDTPEWADHAWVVTVFEDQHNIWRATVMLDPKFPPVDYPLGNTRMDLDRAVRTAETVLTPGWALADWTREATTAATTATRKKHEHE